MFLAMQISGDIWKFCLYIYKKFLFLCLQKKYLDICSSLFNAVSVQFKPFIEMPSFSWGLHATLETLSDCGLDD